MRAIAIDNEENAQIGLAKGRLTLLGTDFNDAITESDTDTVVTVAPWGVGRTFDRGCHLRPPRVRRRQRQHGGHRWVD